MLGWIFGGFIKKLERSTKEVVRDSGKEIDRLFEERLDPLADKLDYIAKKRIGQVEALETKVKDDLESLLNDADEKSRKILEEVNRMREEALKDVRKTVKETDFYLENRINQISLSVMEALQFSNRSIKNAFLEIKFLENKIFQDANYLIDKIDIIVIGTVEQIKNDFQRYLTFPNPFDECRRQLNLHLKFGSQITDIELYRLAECCELSKLSEDTPIEKVVETYAQLQLNSARMAALSRSAPALRQIAVEDWIKYGVLCDFWCNTIQTYDSSRLILEKRVCPPLPEEKGK
ncbi:hypothetical protein K9N68_14195 [Kovacikia minuta CCNUW1]|uniref:hypothetical protein n=1 Tax=Kovacikia minuta TaxID=2931930 RepID=UPI001CCB71AD|nr:hypothetical protein [Kovacikia minuta]UBF28884.1 hypothetical protein K9N68_14195 [Kovacikia minuta CCNUW1]